MDDEKAILESQIKRTITKLFKDFLVIAEDIRQDHLAVVKDLSSQFPPELIQRFNYLNLEKYSRIRKKVLDSGNDAVREIESILKDFSVNKK